MLIAHCRRSIKSPFLYCGVAILLFCIIFALIPISKGENDDKGKIFDDSQYLFSGNNTSLSFLDLNVIDGVVLEPTAPPFLISGKALGSLVDFGSKQEIEHYIVEKGDTLGGIATKFDISLNTLFWANNLNSKTVLKVGQELTILPISGVVHIVQSRDTLSEIAEVYQADMKEIVSFNNLGNEGKICAGDFIIVPNGVKPKVTQQYARVPVSQSYFICPIPSPCRITQGLHWYNAIDFSNGKCGEPVYAAAEGNVQRIGYTALGGNYVRIIHPNGVVTYYGHLSEQAVNAGQQVYQGQIIGYIGYSGVTIPKGPAGCHLHFDVRFAENPFQGYSVGTQF